MRRGTVLMLAALACLALAVPAIAASVLPEPPFETNQECLACHDAAAPGATAVFVDFRVPGEVDYERCKACHFDLPDQVWLGYLGIHVLSHYHLNTAECIDCHEHDYAPYFSPPGDAEPFTLLATTPAGFMRSAASLNASPEVLHDVHLNPGWVETTFGDQYAVGCSRCHASASCSACHSSATPHGDHALPDYPAVTYKQATGSSAVVAASTCVNEYCHAISAAGTQAFNEPACADCHSHTLEDLALAHIPPAEAGFCASCHAGTLDVTHAQAEVVVGDSTYGSCYVCHRADLGPATADCQSCHAEVHAGMEEAHTPSAVNALCASCHPASVEITHQDASTVVDGETHSSCAVCHRIDLGPATSDCQTCHGGFRDHSFGQAVHLASGEGCASRCHSADIIAEHSSRRASVSCEGCHTHKWFPADGWDKTCMGCHPSAHGRSSSGSGGSWGGGDSGGWGGGDSGGSTGGSWGGGDSGGSTGGSWGGGSTGGRR